MNSKQSYICFSPNLFTVLLGLLEIKITFVLPLIYMKCWNILDLVGLPSEISGVQSCPIIPLKQEPKISTQTPLD